MCMSSSTSVFVPEVSAGSASLSGWLRRDRESASFRPVSGVPGHGHEHLIKVVDKITTQCNILLAGSELFINSTGNIGVR